MRLLALTIVFIAVPAVSAETEYPLWDGEPIEEYAKKVNLPPTKTLDFGNGVTMEFVLIPAGKFVMGAGPSGSPWAGATLLLLGVLGAIVLVLQLFLRKRLPGEQRFRFSLAWAIGFFLSIGLTQGGLFLLWPVWKWRPPDRETPSHPVAIRSAFWMSAREVTWRQYDAVMNESRTPAKQDEFPADVCWRDAREFCNDLSTTLRATVRLPTEAEWEFARREGRRIEKYYPPGNEGALNRVGWFEGNSKGSTHPVGQKAPNAFGLYDMQGNVWEFVEDDWHPTFDEAPSDGSAWVDRPRADQRVIKGGSFDFPAWHCRPTSRLYMGIGYCDGRTGFRVVLEAGHSP